MIVTVVVATTVVSIFTLSLFQNIHHFLSSGRRWWLIAFFVVGILIEDTALVFIFVVVLDTLSVVL